MTDHTQNQNPYASPEEVTEVESDARWMTLDEMQALRRGLGWFRWGAVGWLVMALLAGSVLMANAFAGTLGLDGVEAVESGAWHLGFLLFLPTVLTAVPGVTACLWAVARADEDRAGREFLRISWITGVLGFVLLFTYIMAFLSLILWAASFWHWYRFLEFVCRKAGLAEVVGKARAMVTVMIVFLVAAPLFAFMVNGMLFWVFGREPAAMSVGGLISLVLMWAVALLPAVYFGMEIWVLGRMRRKMRNLE